MSLNEQQSIGSTRKHVPIEPAFLVLDTFSYKNLSKRKEPYSRGLRNFLTVIQKHKNSLYLKIKYMKNLIQNIFLSKIFYNLKFFSSEKVITILLLRKNQLNALSFL